MIYSLVRPLLFTLEAEYAHRFTLATLRVLDGLGRDRPLGEPADAGANPVGNTPDQMRQWMKDDAERWAQVIRAAQIKID